MTVNLEQKGTGQVNYGRRAWSAQRGEGEPGEPSLLGAVYAVYYPIPRKPRALFEKQIATTSASDTTMPT